MLVDDCYNVGRGYGYRCWIFWLNDYHGILGVEVVMPNLGLHSILSHVSDGR